MDQGTLEWNDNTSPLSQLVRDDKLADIDATWSQCSLTTITTRPQILLKWPPSKRDIINSILTMTHPLDDESVFQTETGFEQDS